MEFSLRWRSQDATHNDRYFAPKVDFWRDIFPGTMEQPVASLHEGECYEESFGPGELVPAFDQSNVVQFKASHFETHKGASTENPVLGRFYPQAFAWRALNCQRLNPTPYRVVDLGDKIVVADTSHPLARHPLTLEATCVEKLRPAEEYGGSCNDIAEMVTKSGPGMQVRYPGITTDFYSNYPLRRKHEGDDRTFYRSPRLIQHLDETAIGQVRSIYSRLLYPGSKILDLMSKLGVASSGHRARL